MYKNLAMKIDITTESNHENYSDEELIKSFPGFNNHYLTVNGLSLHYVEGGQGMPLICLPGWPQTWYSYHPIAQQLATRYRVIIVDIRGMGSSEKPQSGYDKKTMATDMHELMKKLGYSHINLAGHDIGLMVAYAYAAQFPTEVKKIALMDALLPGIEPVWSQVSAGAWWFGFFGWPASGSIVAGKEREFLTSFWPVVGHVKDPFTKQELEEFIRAYAVSGGTTGSFHWFGAFTQDGKDNLELAKNKLSMPLLAMGGEYFAAAFLKEHAKLVATDVSEVKIMGAGHWLVQEQTEQVQKGLLDFFLGK